MLLLVFWLFISLLYCTASDAHVGLSVTCISYSVVYFLHLSIKSPICTVIKNAKVEKSPIHTADADATQLSS